MNQKETLLFQTKWKYNLIKFNNYVLKAKMLYQNKKAIIIMARQHPGETVGSLIMDEILS